MAPARFHPPSAGNQFGGQEPGTSEEVCTFAKDRFRATFPIMGKLNVNGEGVAARLAS